MPVERVAECDFYDIRFTAVVNFSKIQRNFMLLQEHRTYAAHNVLKRYTGLRVIVLNADR